MKGEFHTSLINIVAKKEEIRLPSADSVFPNAGSAESPLEQYLYRPYKWRNVLSSPDVWISRYV